MTDDRPFEVRLPDLIPMNMVQALVLAQQLQQITANFSVYDLAAGIAALRDMESRLPGIAPEAYLRCPEIGRQMIELLEAYAPLHQAGRKHTAELIAKQVRMKPNTGVQP